MKKTTVMALLIVLGICQPALSADKKKDDMRNFKECAAIRMQEIALKHLETGDPKYFTQVPKGWTVVSGTGGEGHPKLLICR